MSGFALLRYFGGTTNHWGGWCAPPDPIDFEERDSMPHSGWPFSERLSGALVMARENWSATTWALRLCPRRLGYNTQRYSAAVQRASLCMPSAAGKHARSVRPRIMVPSWWQAPHITVYLNANALRFETDAGNKTVQALAVGVLPDHRLTGACTHLYSRHWRH